MQTAILRKAIKSGDLTRESLITRIDPTVPGFLKAVAPDHGSKVADSLSIGA